MQNKAMTLLGIWFSLTSCSHLPPTASSSLPAQTIREGKFEVIPFVGSFKVKRTVFPNGLKLMILKDPSSPTFAYQTWYKVGSRNEVPGKTGLAHLFEHLMFKGTNHHADGEFDALLEQAGAEDENAFTANDHTAYVQELPKNSFDLIANLESDRMVNLIVNDASFKTEREVVQNERRFRKENSAEGTMYQTLFETAFSDHPYHWPVIGYEEDLNRMGAQDARDFYERFYSPDRATVVVVGDVDENEVYRKIEKLYGAIPAKRSADGEIKPEPEQTAQKRKRLELNVEVEKTWLAFKAPALGAQDSPSLEVLQGLLSEGKNSRLNRALVDSGIATEVGSGTISMRDPGLFLIEVNLQKGKSALLAESIVIQELDRLKNAPIKKDELDRATRLMRFRFLERMMRPDEKAHFIGQMETDLGSLEAGLEFQRKVSEVTVEQVRQAAQKYFNTSSLTVITAVPKPAKSGKGSL